MGYLAQSFEETIFTRESMNLPINNVQRIL